MDDRAGLFRPGWIAKKLVYGVADRTARGREGSQVVLLLAEQRRGWSLMISRARATRGLRRPSFGLMARLGVPVGGG